MLDQGPTIALWGARYPGQLDPITDVEGWRIDAETKRDIANAASSIQYHQNSWRPPGNPTKGAETLGGLSAFNCQMQPTGADPVLAVLVFLNLLEGHSNCFA